MKSDSAPRATSPSLRVVLLLLAAVLVYAPLACSGLEEAIDLRTAGGGWPPLEIALGLLTLFCPALVLLPVALLCAVIKELRPTMAALVILSAVATAKVGARLLGVEQGSAAFDLVIIPLFMLANIGPLLGAYWLVRAPRSRKE